MNNKKDTECLLVSQVLFDKPVPYLPAYCQSVSYDPLENISLEKNMILLPPRQRKSFTLCKLIQTTSNFSVTLSFENKKLKHYREP